ncbi:MAG: ATP:cob(I)alamin adenosyltransferase, partial [Thermus sp.]
SALGLARSLLPSTHLDLHDLLERLQNALFDLGADLATRLGSPYEKNIARMDEKDVEALEEAIDRYMEESPPFTGFILP